jgi:hypothetical protein
MAMPLKAANRSTGDIVRLALLTWYPYLTAGSYRGGTRDYICKLHLHYPNAAPSYRKYIALSSLLISSNKQTHKSFISQVNWSKSSPRFCKNVGTLTKVSRLAFSKGLVDAAQQTDTIGDLLQR